MPDDLNIRQPEDPQKVNINQDHEVKYWCQHFTCKPEELKEAVSKVCR